LILIKSDSAALLSIDMPAGPSELLVVANATSNLEYVAADLLSQAEHGVDSQVVLVAVGFDEKMHETLKQALYSQATRLPRCEIVRESLKKSFILNVKSMEHAIEFSNSYAPEHLILSIENAQSYLEGIKNAGSVFLGLYAAESCGDYASGTNHTLPTYGYARMYSGVNTHSFVKHITSQEITKEGLKNIGTVVETLASIEGLEAHKNAVTIRLKDIRDY
jgi:phosphoribosyl-ATP pyrophosphohydrolase/phosphoribosyl-AMP cyclohydrolase/histidinol dehydrogenase